ncbi:MAG: glutamate synthase large subunit [Clostridiales bacterium]|nr:glutamate synthase large subunit [Clostridiales bacterium]
MTMKQVSGLPPKQGLYDPGQEHDACGIGLVVNIRGERSHDIVSQAISVLINLSHRGGAGSEDNSGDGAGILLQIPDRMLRTICPSIGIHLPEPGRYGVGMVFLPRDDDFRKAVEHQIEAMVRDEGQIVLGWRTPPINESTLGMAARDSRPAIRQLFIGQGRCSPSSDGLAFERSLYLIRKRCERLVEGKSEESPDYFYFASLSSRTIVYKGMLTARQVPAFYLDLTSLDMESALALVHARYSTNTFPSWERAHPYRTLAHNGEINTIRGNVNWMRARQPQIETRLFGPDISRVFPVIRPGGSDSAMFDNCLEFLSLGGRSIAHAALMMVPEPWEKHESMADDLKAFYAYHSTLMEPWDGPAAMIFTDGIRVGALLDRNGLRPARYLVTRDDLLVLSSEAGVLDIPPEQVVRRDRLRPGRMLLIDTAAGQLIADATFKAQLARERPYRQWLNDQLVLLPSQGAAPADTGSLDDQALDRQLKRFGYTNEDVQVVINAMARDAIEPIGSMGTDTPLAVLSDRPQLLYNFFKQLFAQVTNPPIDALREHIVTSSALYLGAEGNLVDPHPDNCRRLRLDTPLIDANTLDLIRGIRQPGLCPVELSILCPIPENQGSLTSDDLEAQLSRLFAEAEQAVLRGAGILILSDRSAGPDWAAMPALLACAGLHHHLIRRGLRTRVSLVLDSGEPREVHHFALLVGYGVSAIHPYLALETVRAQVRRQFLPGLDEASAVNNYLKAGTKGLVKVLSKMGISTMQSYQGAQIFEAVGIGSDLIDRYFCDTPSRIGGIGLDAIARTVNTFRQAADDPNQTDPGLDSGGQYRWRSQGEEHLFNPLSVHMLQQAVRSGDYKQYQAYAHLMNDTSRRHMTLRGLFDLIPARESVPLDDVEPVEAIVRRFKTGAMSYGSLSQEAHETLAIAMNRLGGKSNTGEGGEDPQRFEPLTSGDSRCSAIKQVASGRFGVTSNYLVHAQELQIKMAQGAKPGEGGQLPGRKVYPWIAKTRHATPGVGLISPPPHHDIYSIEDLAELIHDLKNANDEARISVKLVSEAGVGTIAAGVAKGRADVILISGYDGGTGASPLSSIRHAGLPWELGLAETHQTLLLNDLRSRITVETDGKLLTGRDVAVAALLGAEEFGFATGPLIALGCIMMRVCNLDTCPVGVATQNPDLRCRFTGKPEHVENFMRFIAMDLREIMAELGFRTINEMVGRVDRLDSQAAARAHPDLKLDLSRLVHEPDIGRQIGRYGQFRQDHGLSQSMDQQILLPICQSALRRGLPVQATLPIHNVNRVTGTSLGSAITRRYGPDGLPEDTIQLTFVGSAGQSFAAFIPRGLTMVIEGEANDYIGKGLSGGKVVVRPDHRAIFRSEENVIVGNVAFYGATAGEAYIAGAAGERFCVRNSGLDAVVEAVGDHGCEYMTGGRVVVLGHTGRNFAAGMSGGIAYVLDADNAFARRCNQETVSCEKLTDPVEARQVYDMVARHCRWTQSTYAASILAHWEDWLPYFMRVMPRDYQRVLEAAKAMRQEGLDPEQALMAAFTINARDLARVSGN